MLYCLQDFSLQRNGDRNGFIVPDLDQLLKEYNLPAPVDDISIGKNEQSLVSKVQSPVESTSDEHDMRNTLERLEA